LKGAAANFEDEALVTAARSMEEIGRTARFDDGDAAWRALTSAADRLLAILHAVPR
jgi:hypothetical protein